MKYDRMKRLKDKEFLDGSTFIQALEFRIGTFVVDFVKPFKDKFTWNNFFQFVVYFSLAPMVAIIYTTVNILREVNQNTVSWDDLLLIVNKLHTEELITNNHEMLFKKFENKNGTILFNYFLKFVDSSFELWKPLYQFKIAMLEKFFPESAYKDILHRKLDITYIKRYQISHNNKFPPTSTNCMTNFISTVLNTPNKNRYDYDFAFYRTYRFSDIIRNFIRYYDPTFENIVFRFNLKNLSKKTEFDVINEMDEMYIHFNTYGSAATTNSINVSNYSRHNSSSRNNSASRHNSASNSRHNSSRSIVVKQGASVKTSYLAHVNQSTRNSTTVTKSILRTSSLKYTSSNNVIKVVPAKPVKCNHSEIELNEKNVS